MTNEQKRKQLAALMDDRHKRQVEAAKEAIGALAESLQTILGDIHDEFDDRYDRSDEAVEELIEAGLMEQEGPSSFMAAIPEHVQQALDELKSEGERQRQGQTTPGAEPGGDSSSVSEAGEESEEQDSSEEDGDGDGESGDDGDGDGDGSDGDGDSDEQDEDESDSEDESEDESDQEQVIWRVSGIPK